MNQYLDRAIGIYMAIIAILGLVDHVEKWFLCTCLHRGGDYLRLDQGLTFLYTFGLVCHHFFLISCCSGARTAHNTAIKRTDVVMGNLNANFV